MTFQEREAVLSMIQDYVSSKKLSNASTAALTDGVFFRLLGYVDQEVNLTREELISIYVNALFEGRSLRFRERGSWRYFYYPGMTKQGVRKIGYAGIYGNNTVVGPSGDAFVFRGYGYLQMTFRENFVIAHKIAIRMVGPLSMREFLASPFLVNYGAVVFYILRARRRKVNLTEVITASSKYRRQRRSIIEELTSAPVIGSARDVIF